MSSRSRLLAACLLSIGLACGGGDGNPAGQGHDFAPTSNATISGSQSYESVTIPAGVTVTVTSDLTLNVSGNVTLAGTLRGDCVAITIKATGVFSSSGTINNSCANLPESGGPGLLVIGAGGINIDGGETITSGDSRFTNDPAQTLATPPATGPVFLRAPTEPVSATVGCVYRNYRTSFIPATAAKGADKDPKGDPGKDGHYKDLGPCIGGAIIDGLTMTGQKGGDGGKGTHTGIGADAEGGKAGNAGAMLITAPTGDITIRGTNTITTPNGGKGGDAEAKPRPNNADGTVARAGAGGNAAPTRFNGSPLTIQASAGRIIVDGTLNVVIGDGGAGGDATSTGGDGASGCPGGNGGSAESHGGIGGSTADKQISASQGVTGAGSILLSKGNGGNGGKSTSNGGSGGGGNPACGGGHGGTMQGFGGNGGDARTRDQLGAITGDGGVGGTVFFAAGGGGPSGGNCPNDGIEGGSGGDATGVWGLGGTGKNPGADGKAQAGSAGIGGKGGAGKKPGKGGAGGANVVPAVDPTGGSFIAGADGDPCPNPVPHVDQVGILSVDPATGQTIIQVTGTGFVAGSVINYNGAALATAFLDDQHLSAVIPAPPPYTASVTVTSPTPGGGTSNSTAFTHPCAPKPVTLGQAINGSVTSKSCGGSGRFQEVFRVDAPSGGVLHLTVTSGYPVRVVVKDKDGKNVVFETQSQGNFNRDIVLPPGGGPFDIQVSATDNSAAGAFTLMATAGTGDANCQIVPWIGKNGVVSGTTDNGCDLGGIFRRVQYLVNLQPGEAVLFIVNANGWQPILRLVDALTGQVVRQDNNNGNLTTAQITFTASAEHPYIVQVFNKQTGGTYTLTFDP